MKSLLLGIVVVVLSCCKTPTEVKTPTPVLPPFTVCNTVASRSIMVSTGIVSGGVAISQTYICMIYGVGCDTVSVPDSTIIVCVTNTGTYANLAHRGEYWSL